MEEFVLKAPWMVTLFEILSQALDVEVKHLAGWTVQLDDLRRNPRGFGRLMVEAEETF